MCSLLDRPVHGTVTAGQTGRYRQGTILRYTSSDCGRIRPSVEKRRTPRQAAALWITLSVAADRYPHTRCSCQECPDGEHSWQAGRHATSVPRMPSASPLPDDKESPHGALHAGPRPVALVSRFDAARPGARRHPAAVTRRLPDERLAGRDHRLGRDLHPGDHRVERPGRQHAGRLRSRRRDRRLVGRLDRVLGRHHLQHDGGDRDVRGLQAVADPPGDRGYPGPDDAHGLGARCPAGRARRVRVSLGCRRPHPHRARGGRPGGDQGRRAREQRARLVRRPGRPGHRPGRGDQPAAAVTLGLDRQDRRDPRAAAALDPDLPRQRQARAARRLAAGHCRLAGLYRWAVPDRRVRRPVPA